MIKRANEIPSATLSNVRGGEGELFLEYLATPEEMYDHASSFCKATLYPGSSIGKHQHIGNEEIFYILSGTAEYIDDDETYQIGPGDVTICQDQHFHGMTNNSQENVVYIAEVIIK